MDRATLLTQATLYVFGIVALYRIARPSHKPVEPFLVALVSALVAVTLILTDVGQLVFPIEILQSAVQNVAGIVLVSWNLALQAVGLYEVNKKAQERVGTYWEQKTEKEV